MAAVTTTRSTLDITFHVNDNTVMGTNYTWKFNCPLGGASSTLTLNDVRQAFTGNGSTFDGFLDPTGYFGSHFHLLTKEGYPIDGIDGAKIVTTTTTKNELS